MSLQINRFPFSLRKPAAAGILALAALLPAPALADWDWADVGVVDLVSERLEVQSNGTDYVGVNGLANLVADVNIEVDTGIAGGVKSWKIWLGLAGEHSDSLWFPQYGASKSYPWYARPRRVDRTERLIVPAGLWSGYVTAHCNELADALRAQGLGNTAIFAEDRTLQLAVPVDYDIDTTGAGSGSILNEGGGGGAKVEVVCKKWAGFAVPQASSSLTTEEAEVVDWSLAVSETSGLSGVCKIRLTGAIATDHLNVDVSFRYKDKAGHESQVWTVNTGAAKFAAFNHWYNVPNGEGPETGSVRMIGVSHPFESAWVDYEMNCVQGGPNTLTSDAPPKLTIKSIKAEGKKMVNGHICPDHLRLVGEVEGRDAYSGYVAFLATSGPFWITPPQAYDLDEGDTQLVVGNYPLWNDAAVLIDLNEPLVFKRSFAFRATDANNAIIASVPVDHTQVLKCVRPALNPALGGAGSDFGVQPRQPAAPTTTLRLQQQPQPVQPQPVQPTAPRLQQQPANPTPQIILPRQPLKQAN